MKLGSLGKEKFAEHTYTETRTHVQTKSHIEAGTLPKKQTLKSNQKSNKRSRIIISVWDGPLCSVSAAKSVRSGDNCHVNMCPFAAGWKGRRNG